MNAKTPPPAPDAASLERELQAALGTPPPDSGICGAATGSSTGPADLAPLPPGSRLADPTMVSRTARKVVQMLDRGFAKNLYGAALNASGGDKEWSAGIVAGWAWSEQDLDDVADLVRQTLEMYQAAHMLRPDLLLLLAVGTHAAGYVTTLAALRQRAAEAQRIAAAAKTQAASSSATDHAEAR